MSNAKESTQAERIAWRNDIKEDNEEPDWNDDYLKAQKLYKIEITSV